MAYTCAIRYRPICIDHGRLPSSVPRMIEYPNVTWSESPDRLFKLWNPFSNFTDEAMHYKFDIACSLHVLCVPLSSNNYCFQLSRLSTVHVLRIMWISVFPIPGLNGISGLRLGLILNAVPPAPPPYFPYVHVIMQYQFTPTFLKLKGYRTQ